MKTFLLTTTTFVMATLSPTSAQTITSGHWDIKAKTDTNNVRHLKLELHNHDDDTEYALGASGGPILQFGFGNSNGTAAGPQSSLLVSANGTTNSFNVWFSAHDGATADQNLQPFVGFSGGALPGPGWTNNVSFTLLSMSHTGGGKLFLFQDDEVVWNTALTLGSAPNYGSFTVGVGQHDHGEFAFTHEGLYTLTLEVSGTYNDGTSTSTLTSSPTTLKINVVPEPSSGALLLVGMAALAAVRQKIRRTVQI